VRDMNQQRMRRIAEFVDQRITLPRQTGPYFSGFGGYGWNPYYGIQRPSVEELASELIHDAEFRSLQLGHWLGTTEGEVIATAVETVTPPFFRQDVELLVEGLKLAAQMQQREGEVFAGRVALGTLVVAGIFALAYKEGGSIAKA